ncbi:MAG TPA: DUF3418 domain-containing protein, partial [Terrimesophilobacter sp.]|nr:DUF3418 domain-containing protein [Terrimesophilobacter sp.]
ELTTALIKSLPKAIRRHVVPAADWARRLLETAPDAPPADQSLREFLAAEIRRQTHMPIDPDDFDLGRVPDHLRVSFAAVDEHGTRVGSSKDLAELQSRLKAKARTTVARVHERTPHALERAGLTSWDFEVLSRTLDTKVAGNTVRGYPTLVDAGATVDIRVLDTADDQAREHRKGVLRMLLLATPAPLDYVQDHLTANEKLLLARSPYPSNAALFADCMLAVVDDALGPSAVWSRDEFEAVRDRLSASVVDTLFATVSLVSRTLAAAREAENAIKAASSISLMAPLADARQQLESLVYPGFVSLTGLARLRRLPLYLDGIAHRVAKLAENPGRDRQWLTEVETATAKYRAAGGQMPLQADAPAHLARVRWLLEEFRLSLFAQHLGAAEPVSVQRITKALAQ